MIRKTLGRSELFLIFSLLSVGLVFGGIVSCDQFVLWELLEESELDTSGEELIITPGSAYVTFGSVIQFITSGGYPPYAYTIVSGSGAIDQESGLYTAPDQTSVDVVRVVVVRVVDAAGATADSQLIVTE